MTSSTSDQAWLQLTAAPGIGPHTIRLLLRVYHTSSAVIAAAQEGFTEVIELPEPERAHLASCILKSAPTQELILLKRHGGRLLPMDDPSYPPALMRIPDPPPLLRVAGDVSVLNRMCVAVVGTRRCTDVGQMQANRFASMLAQAGVTVISGGARGIDVAAHRAALRAGGPTAVVMGSGLGVPYPPEHSRFYDEVRNAGGVLISEWPTDQSPRPAHFPRRNRIISGLSEGVLVIEAPVRSGAMLTARMAVESHGRMCWAVAADAGRLESRGAMEAIRDGWAACVLDPIDVLADVAPVRAGEGHMVDAEKDSCHIEFNPAQHEVITGLRRGGRSIGVLIEASTMPVRDIMAAVTTLELLGAVKRAGQQVMLTPAGLIASQRSATQPS